MMKIFNRDNLTIILLVGLIGHNIYLQFQVEDTLIYASNASTHARRAASYASDASDYAYDAASNSDDASTYARRAASYASDAASYASDAASNAFGNECWSCP